jgi:hypothetical protein
MGRLVRRGTESAIIVPDTDVEVIMATIELRQGDAWGRGADGRDLASSS